MVTSKTNTARIHAIMEQHWVGIGPMLPASAGYLVSVQEQKGWGEREE